MATKTIRINKFFGGTVRDDKSKIPGAASNIEEVDIFSNADYIQAEQIFSSDSMPASTEIYAKTADLSDIVYGYGKETADNKVRLVSVASGGGTDPGAFATLFTSADTADLAYSASPIQFFRQDNGNKNFLYYVTKNASNVCRLKRFDIVAGTEHEDDSGATAMTLTQLDGSFDRIVFQVMFGELFITNGKFVSKVDKDGVFTEDAFTLPNGWEVVDIIPVSDVCIILARNINRNSNECKGFWWDLTDTLQVDDSFDIPYGGPQWIVNHKETIKIFCAISGKGKFYQLSGAFPGAVPIELPGLVIENIATETSTQPISSKKMVNVKDNILYFGLYKTDKTGVYGLGQLDSDKPTALVLSKRFSTGDYATHKPTSLFIQGPNFYADYYDGTNNVSVRCESLNSPNRSSSGIYESVIIDDNDPTTDKNALDAYVTTRPLPASTDVNFSLSPDYGSYTEYFRADGTSFNTENSLIGRFDLKNIKAKVFKVKVQIVSSTSNSPKVTAIGLTLNLHDNPASK